MKDHLYALSTYNDNNALYKHHRDTNHILNPRKITKLSRATNYRTRIAIEAAIIQNTKNINIQVKAPAHTYFYNNLVYRTISDKNYTTQLCS